MDRKSSVVDMDTKERSSSHSFGARPPVLALARRRVGPDARQEIAVKSLFGPGDASGRFPKMPPLALSGSHFHYRQLPAQRAKKSRAGSGSVSGDTITTLDPADEAIDGEPSTKRLCLIERRGPRAAEIGRIGEPQLFRWRRSAGFRRRPQNQTPSSHPGPKARGRTKAARAG